MSNISKERELLLKKKISSLNKQLLAARKEKKAIKAAHYRLHREEMEKKYPIGDTSGISVRGVTRFAPGATDWRSAYTNPYNPEDPSV